MILVLGKNGQLSKSIYKVSNLERNQFWSSEELNLEITNKIQAKLETFKPKLIINTTSFNNVDDAELIIHQTLKLISMQLKRLQIFAKGLILVLFMFQQIMSLMAKKIMNTMSWIFRNQ